MNEKLNGELSDSEKVVHPVEELKYVDMPTTDSQKEGHFRIIDGSGPKVEDPEKLKQPGEIMPSVQSSDAHYSPEMIVRDKDGRLSRVTSILLVEDTENYKEYDDPSIKKPSKMVNPEIDICYNDGVVVKIKVGSRLPRPVYKNPERPVKEGEEFYEFSHLELRGYDFKLGELVSFGNGVGRLALINPGESPQLGIVAESVRGKGGTETRLWAVDANLVDYVVHNEKGAIRRYPDSTLFKPTLGNSEFPNDPGH